jgi:hypothetical protein
MPTSSPPSSAQSPTDRSSPRHWRWLWPVAVALALAAGNSSPTVADGEAAYILAAPNDPTWLTLVTREGRWAVQFDTSVCPPLPPGSQVLLDGPTPTSAVWSGVTRCPLAHAIFVDPTPCATSDGQCAVDLEPRG